MPRLLISAGEASGDAYGSAIISRLSPDWKVEAIGGKRLRDAGASMIASSDHWGAIGIVEAFRVGPRVFRGMVAAKQALRTKPGLFIPIDYGFLNVRLATFAKSRGWTVLYFVPPGSWRRDRQGVDLIEACDHIVTPFAWSEAILRQMAAAKASPCRVHFFGHPLKQLVAERRRTLQESRKYQLAILAGSRMHEITHNLPVMAEVVRKLNIPVEFAVAPTVTAASLEEAWRKLSPSAEATFTEGDTYGVFLRSRAAIVCSGTATLESALCECPCTVMYRGGKMMEMEYRIRRPKFDFFSLPNILAQKAIVPERLQWDATPDRVLADVRSLLADGPEREAQLAAFEHLSQELGEASALDRTVELVESLTVR